MSKIAAARRMAKAPCIIRQIVVAAKDIAMDLKGVEACRNYSGGGSEGRHGAPTTSTKAPHISPHGMPLPHCPNIKIIPT